MMLQRALVLGFVLFAARGRAQMEFSYEGDDGPDRWVEQYPKCGGRRQSPVNIQVNRTQKATNPALWLLYSAHIPWEATLTNNGHTALVELDDWIPITLHGGPLKATYVFQQLHFHWGSNDSVGSEHAFNSVYSAMEMHMVFYKQSYGNPLAASNHSDGFAVLGTMLDLNDNGSPVLPPIVRGLQDVTNYNDSTTLDRRIALASLLPNRWDLYFTYQGSLTTPPCDEAVTWIIFDQHVPVSSEQVSYFRTLMTEEGTLLTSNRRPVQPLNDRIVQFARNSYSRRRTAPAATAAKKRGHRAGRRQ